MAELSEGGIHQMSMELGGLKQAVETMTKMWAQQEIAANEGRRKLHDKFEVFRDEVREKMTSVSHRVDILADKVNLIEPSVKGFNEEKFREEGSKRLGKVLVAAFGVVTGGIGWGVHELIGYFHK
jgi:hypothetical protein